MNRTELLDVLGLVRPAVATKDLIPCLTDMCFDDGQITAYNNTFGVRAFCEDLPINGLVPGAMLMNLLRAVDSETAEFENTKDGSGIKVTCGKSTMTLALTPKDQYPFEYPDESTAKTKFALDAPFLAALQVCMVSTLPEPAAPHFSGVTIKHTKQSVIMYSSDNDTITRVTMTDRGGDDIGDFILPAEFCKHVVAMEESYKEYSDLYDAEGGEQPAPTVYINDKFVIVDYDGIFSICTRLIDDTGDVDFESTVVSALDGVTDTMVSAPEGLDAAMTRSNIISSVHNTGCAIEMTGDKITLTTSATGVGDVVDTFAIEGGTDASAILNPSYVRRALGLGDSVAIGPTCFVVAGEGKVNKIIHLIAYMA